jgi:RNA polymerase sigma-70 factor, ECF subfamily
VSIALSTEGHEWARAEAAVGAGRARGETAVAGELRVVQAARGGDRGAFAQLYELYAPVVHGILLATAQREEVGDLVQEVFLSALRGIERLERPERFAGWLATIARNCARDAHRVRHRTEELADDGAPPAPGNPGTPRSNGELRELEDREETMHILELIRGLPEAYRETLVLRLVEGLDGPRIARRTGLTPGSVRVNLCRGMKLLRERLEDSHE